MLFPPLLASLVIASSAAYVYAGWPDAGYDVQKVKDQMVILATHSWEYGTASEALLELDTPSLSVFGDRPFPVPDNPSSSAMVYAKPHIQLDSSTLVDGDGKLTWPVRSVKAVRYGANTIPFFFLCRRSWGSGVIGHHGSAFGEDRFAVPRGCRTTDTVPPSSTKMAERGYQPPSRIC